MPDTNSAITVTRETDATPAEVWAVIADGWTYPVWVVGAARMRAVSADWPAVGARLHHSAGSWPTLLDDTTTVLEVEPERRIRLQAKGRPFGEATVEIELTPTASGTTIEIREDVTRGPSRLLPKPARQAAIGARNTETLTRLALMAERATTPGERRTSRSL